jgi:hypothetical protein
MTYVEKSRIVTVTLGRPFSIADDDIDVPLPSNDDETSVGSASTPNGPVGEQRHPRISPFLHLIKMRIKLSHVHQSLYTSARTRDLAAEEKMALRSQLMAEMKAWRSDISHLSFSANVESHSSLSCFDFKEWYEVLYHTTVLTIFRPSPALPHDSHVFHDESTLRILWEASRATILGYKTVLRARRLNYSWVCLYTVFMAGLANIYSIARIARTYVAGLNSFLPPILLATSDCRDCSNVLMAICERWDDARTSCEVFDRLANGALTCLLSAHHSFTSASHAASAATLHCTTQAARHLSPNLSTAEPAEASSMGATAYHDGIGLQTSDDSDTFEGMFLALQATAQEYGYGPTNEVTMSLDHHWFPSFL